MSFGASTTSTVPGFEDFRDAGEAYLSHISGKGERVGGLSLATPALVDPEGGRGPELLRVVLAGGAGLSRPLVGGVP
jgi:hypothetical protein